MIQNGDEVIDTVSGFKGIVISDTVYLQGCNRVGVQPKIKKNGELPKSHAFDKPQLKLVKSKRLNAGMEDLVA